MRVQLKTRVFALAFVTLAAPAHADDDWSVTTDSLIYSDTDNVLVVSPQVAVHRKLDDEGGDASARVVVDMVSAASVDVVSHATERFSEVRTEADLGFSKSFGKLVPSLAYRYSHESDYDAHGFGVGLQRTVGSPDTTVAVGYDLSLDRVGYTHTPASVFSEHLQSNTLTASLTQVLGPKTLVRAIYTLSIQRGYMEKPYRFVPLFDAAGVAAAASDGVTLDLATFDRYRLPLRPAESVPDQRIGHAVGIRALRYLGFLPGSLRLDYQFFADSWAVMAHTVEPSLSWKLTDSTLLVAYGRVYLQNGARFWRRAYVIDGELPRYRTLDRDLSDFYAITGGTRFQWKGEMLSAYADLGASDTVYQDYMFLTSRVALVAQVGLHVQF